MADVAQATGLTSPRAVELCDWASSVALDGGAEGESLHLLDLSPWPETPLRALLAPARVQEDLDRLEAAQGDDGGWQVDFESYSPAATEEWKGYATVKAVQVLTANGRTHG